MKGADEYLEMAMWWPAVGELAGTIPPTRKLNGEIMLAKELKPTTSIPFFSISVSAYLYLPLNIFPINRVYIILVLH